MDVEDKYILPNNVLHKNFAKQFSWQFLLRLLTAKLS